VAAAERCVFKKYCLLLGTINEFWNASKKSTLMICVIAVFAAKGLETETLGNNVADSGKSRIGGAPVRHRTGCHTGDFRWGCGLAWLMHRDRKN
jgi:hypothetical protein